MKYFAQALIVGAVTALSLTKEDVYPAKVYKGPGEGLDIEYVYERDKDREFIRDVAGQDKLGTCEVESRAKPYFELKTCNGDEVNISLPMIEEDIRD